MNNQKQLFSGSYLVSDRYQDFYNTFVETVAAMREFYMNSFIPAIESSFIPSRKCITTNFADGELRLATPAHFYIHNGILKIVHSLIDDSSVLELLFILEMMNRNKQCKGIELVIPYMRYSRQNKVVDNEPTSAKSIIKAILSHSKKIYSIEFFDLHDETILNYIDDSIYTSNQSSAKLFLSICGNDGYKIFDHNTVAVAPDMGAIKRARCFAENTEDITIVDKVRNEHGKPQIVGISGKDVNEKVCVIVDDIVDSAGTLCQTAKLLKEKGATKVYACITHGVFSGDAIQKIEDSDIERLFVTDSNKFDIKDSTKIEVIPFAIQEVVLPLACMSHNEAFEKAFNIHKELNA